MPVSIIPESAPFNTEQRAWLNGFLAGWLGIQDATGAPAAPLPAFMDQSPATAPTPATEPDDDDHPWHDPALPILDRLSMAEGRPFPQQLMAAMAQLDCGTCGYDCRTYSEALARGEESSTSLCSPGGAETSRAIKRLLKSRSNPAAPAPTPAPSLPVSRPRVAATPTAWTRSNPYPATILRSVRLNKPGSEKEVYHIEIDLGDSGITYKVGDALGIYPTNCGDLVDALLGQLGAAGTELLGSTETLRDALTQRLCLVEATDDSLVLLAESASDPHEAAQICSLIDGEEGVADGTDILDLLRRFPSARPSAVDLARTLAPLRARLYSISSAPGRHAGQVHLTVARASSVVDGRPRKGVASTMLADRVGPGSRVRIFIQEAHGFTIPADPTAPMIMIGPGTGIAPFRAFLHERDARGAAGKNWLFFGEQRQAFDFLYEDELADLAARGVLTRLETAFSRDGDRKTYVQHRILEQGAEVYRWLRDGASLFVCGDARRMAADVDRALREVIQVHGEMGADAAGAHLARLAADGRYHRDVY